MTDFVNISDVKLNIMFKCQMLFDVYHPSNSQQATWHNFLEFSKLVLNYTFLTVLSHTLILLVSFIPATAKDRIFISFIDEWISGILVLRDIIPIKSHINLLQAA